jgi:hypothetical protein
MNYESGHWSHYDVLKDFAGPAVTLLGFVVTAVIAYFGFRSFRRWKLEQLEERRMEIAFQALKLAYQSTFVFDHIRSPLIEGYEWEDMPQNAGDDENKRRRRGGYFAVMKRIELNKDFFKALWDIQPACMAIFGSEIQATFLELHQARQTIVVACQSLNSHLHDLPQIPDPHKDFWKQLRADISSAEGPLGPEGDRVGKQLTAFREGIERVCSPLVKHAVGLKSGQSAAPGA